MKMYSTVITVVGLTGCLVFVVGYWYKTGGSCWKDEAGRFLMSFIGTVGILFALGLLRPILPAWNGWRYISIGTYTAFVLELWWPLRLLFKAQQAAQMRRRLKDGS